MATAIRKHFRDFLAVAALLVLGLAVSYYIVQKQRLRIPILEEKPFQLKAEFATAQAVTPGQGQTVSSPACASATSPRSSSRTASPS